MKTKNSLQNNKTESKFSDSVFRDIYHKLITKHKDETERQHLIRAIILIYKAKYPAEIREFAKIMDKKRELITNEYASDNEQGQRLLFRFPESLMHRLTMLVENPPFLSQSNPMTKEEENEWTWFMDSFPEFTVPKKL